MAVIVQYIVIRDGVQKMTFATKKEADAYDKMLDIADNLYDFIETANLEMDDKLLEDLTFFLAKNKDQTMDILRGAKPKPGKTPKVKDTAQASDGSPSETDNKDERQAKTENKLSSKGKKSK